MGFKKRSWLLIGSVAISLIIGTFVGIYISNKSFSPRFFFSKENKIETILDYIYEEYVDSVQINELTEKALPHILDELDPHSSYISAQDALLIAQDMDGTFGGIGVEVNSLADTIVIVKVTAGSPAEQAGILPGDRIVTIDGASYFDKGLSFEETLDLLKGKIGTIVKVGIQRNNIDKVIPFSITRESIPLETVVAYPVSDKIGLIKINDHFTNKTYDEFMRALAKLSSLGCADFIIDLRGNGGGSMETALNIANELLPLGRMIVYTEGKSFPEEPIYANGTGKLLNGQLIVLIDQLSASASEILAGAVQDNDRGLIMGRRSYGKGLIQNHIELEDGSALRLTVARYYTPSGRNIQRPYKLGQSKEYNQEWVDLLLSGESFHQDSLKTNSDLVFKTFKGRTVYGGGGIMPDIFVPLDTTALTTYYIDLENAGIFLQFAFDYTDSNREFLKEFKTYPEMLSYLTEEPLLWEITRYAETQGIRRRSNLIYKSQKQILKTTYAYILRNFFGDEAFFAVLMDDDLMIKRAVESIEKGEALSENISSLRYLAQ